MMHTPTGTTESIILSRQYRNRSCCDHASCCATKNAGRRTMRRRFRHPWATAFSVMAVTVTTMGCILQQDPCYALASSLVPQRTSSLSASSASGSFSQQQQRQQQQPLFPFITDRWFPPEPQSVPRGGSSDSTPNNNNSSSNSSNKKRSHGEPLLPFLPHNHQNQNPNEQQQHPNEHEGAYQKRKDEWVAKYTTVDALRRTFGTNRNGLWGDLDPRTARRLYKTLLPRALLELYKMGVRVEDLAPLAYQARVAAKLYARERCTVPGRIAAELYDGIRQWRKYGTFDTSGMTYEQIWNKYASLILEEYETEECFTEQDVTAKICLKILERSCQTNEQIDKLVHLEDYYSSQQNEVALSEIEQDLAEITHKLEKDVRALLDSCQDAKPIPEATIKRAQRFKTLRMIVRARQRIQSRGSRGKRDGDDDEECNVPKGNGVSTAPEGGEHSFPWRNRSKPWEQRQLQDTASKKK